LILKALSFMKRSCAVRPTRRLRRKNKRLRNDPPRKQRRLPRKTTGLLLLKFLRLVSLLLPAWLKKWKSSTKWRWKASPAKMATANPRTSLQRLRNLNHYAAHGAGCTPRPRPPRSSQRTLERYNQWRMKNGNFCSNGEGVTGENQRG